MYVIHLNVLLNYYASRHPQKQVRKKFPQASHNTKIQDGIRLVQRIHIVDFSVGDLNETWFATTQIDESVKLEHHFVFEKASPRKKCAT